MRRTRSALALIAWFVPCLARAETPASSCAHDAALDPLARAAIEMGERARSAPVRDLAEQSGELAPTVSVWLGRGDESAATSLANAWIVSRVVNAAWARCGVAHAGDLHAVVLVPRSVRVRGAVSELTRGATLELAWTLPAGTASPSLYVAREDEPVTSRAVGDSATVALDAPGVYTFQLVAQTAWGPLPFALWHTRVGEASSSATRDTTATVNANESVVIANAFAWVGALNRTRASRGTERVGSDPLLATLAQERAEQMARAGAVLHARGAGDDPRSRAERAGVATERLAENVVRARTLAEAFARLQQSPAHRAQREDAAMDAVGVGIARRDEVVYVVELLAQRPRLR